jgi:ACS family hexuronate transporter-like MFS transporter
MKLPRMKWIVATLLCLATMLNYADRLTLSVVSRTVRREFALDERDYAQILALFMSAYAIMYAGSGYLVDRLGTRRGFAVFITSWSMAQMLHAATVGKWSMGACRFLLGLAEPGNWPAAAKAVAEWFPASQRALGVGIFNAGSSMGSAIAPPLVAFITLRWGWRASFLVTGGLGLVWLAAWLAIYRSPEGGGHSAGAGAPQARVDWKRVVRMPGCYTLIVTRFFTDPVLYFAIFWLPEYLQKERGFDIAMVGKYAWVPFIFGDIGYVLGGWLSGRLMRAGWRLPRARKTVMALGAACMPAVMGAPFVPEAWMAIAATCFLTFGHALWVANLQTLPTDLFRGGEIGTATGFSGTGGAIGGMLANLGTGYLVAGFSYAPVFVIAGLMHPLSMLITWRLLPDRVFPK